VSRALQGAVDRRGGRFQEFRGLGGGPAQNIAKHQHRALARRELLDRRHECQLH